MAEAQSFRRLQTRAVPAAVVPPDNPRNIQEMMDRIVYVSPLRGYPVRVMVVNDPKINAHTDGLTVYLNSGLLNIFMGHDDLVASVLAHELGHILANHQPEGKPRTSAWSYLSYLTPALNALPYGGFYSGIAGSAVREGVQIHLYSYDRHQENEADVIGAYLASEAGYNALGLCQFLDYAGRSGFSTPKTISIPTSVSAIPQSAAVMLLSSSPLYQTHPPSKKRKKNVELLLQRKKGLITQAEFRRKSGWAANIYEKLEKAKPY